MRRFLNIVQNVLFIAVLSLLCSMLYSIHVEHEVSIFDYRFLRILSNSMKPTLNPNDCIVVKEVPEKELHIGDIITFISTEDGISGQYNTHRIYGIGVDEATGIRYYITKGDYFDTPDYSYVIYENVIGKYVKKLPLGKTISFIVTKLSNNKVYFLVIILPLILCLLTYIYQLIRIFVFGAEEIKKERK